MKIVIAFSLFGLLACGSARPGQNSEQEEPQAGLSPSERAVPPPIPGTETDGPTQSRTGASRPVEQHEDQPHHD